MVVAEVTVERISAVENLFGRYVCDSKNEVKIQERKKNAKSNSTQSKSSLENNEQRSRKHGKFIKEIPSNSRNGKTKNRARNNDTRKKQHSKEEIPENFKLFENPISKLADLLFPSQVKSENLVNNKDKDKLCHLLSSLFNSTDKNDDIFSSSNKSKFVIKERKSLTVLKDEITKRNKNPHRAVQIHSKSKHALNTGTQKVKKYRKHRSNKNEMKDGQNTKQSINMTKLLNPKCYDKVPGSTTVTNMNQDILKFSYHKNINILEIPDKGIETNEKSLETKVKNIKQDVSYDLGQGEREKLNNKLVNYVNCTKNQCQKLSKYITREDQNSINEIHNLAKIISLSRPEVSFIVQFSNTDRSEPHRKTISELMEEAHFGGSAPAIIKKSYKVHFKDEVNEPVEDEYWISNRGLSRESEIDQICEEKITRNEEVMDETNKELLSISSSEKSSIRPKKMKKKSKRKTQNWLIAIIRKCLCLGKKKSLSETSTSADEKVANRRPTSYPTKYWHSPVNQLYIVKEDNTTKGFKPDVRKKNGKKRKRPSLKVSTAKLRRKEKLKKIKSSQLKCCIEWNGQKEGQIQFGNKRKKQCINFKIDKLAKMGEDNDGEKVYSLQAVLSPH